jgi:hypothetical protein
VCDSGLLVANQLQLCSISRLYLARDRIGVGIMHMVRCNATIYRDGHVMHRVDGGEREEEMEGLLGRIIDRSVSGGAGGGRCLVCIACTPGRHGSIGDQSVAFLHASSSSRAGDDTSHMHSLRFLHRRSLSSRSLLPHNRIYTHALQLAIAFAWHAK